MAILLTKVRPPQRRKDILRRVRLVDTIHQNLHRKLTFVSAPAGYGKTTLLVDFASDVDAIVCWYLISPGDNELIQFSKHIVAAFQQQFPEFGQELDQVLNSAGESADPGSIAAELINEIEKHVGDFCVLILDDYHLAGENEQIIDFLENLLEHLPDQLRILIGSRSVYGIPTANLYVRDELVTISAEELRFRADELQKLVLQNYHVRLSQEQASELAKRADGWIVAIMLAIRSMENGALPKFVGATEQVYGYLAEEVVNRQTPELRDFMYSTSIFDDFTEELCNFVLETKESGALLKSLEERNLFVSRTESTEGLSYRYHQLFSEFLLDHFEKSDAKRLKALHNRAAEWYRKREQWETAIRHKLASGEGEEAAKWIDKLANHYYTAGRQPLISQWYRAIKEPKDYTRNAPHLLLYQAKIVGNQNHLAESEQLLDVAQPLLEKSNDTESVANAFTTRGMIKQFTGKYKEAIVLADKAQELLSGKNKRAEAKHQAYQAKRLEAICRHYLGDSEKGLEVLTEAIEAFHALVDESEGSNKQRYQFDLAETLNDLGLIYLATGRILEAQKAFQEALEIHLKSRGNLSALALTRNNIAYVY
ncbi:MAG: hypothetical protein DWG76_01225 [Chloroflexi bacterium]|nr:hypothetical protein [Chloroflexota bacterium]MQC26059.1 hypothetical protein [Chloroflexota bacterium]